MRMFIQEKENGEFAAELDRLAESEFVVLSLLLVVEIIRDAVHLDQDGERTLHDRCRRRVRVILLAVDLLLQVRGGHVQNPIEQREDERFNDANVVSHESTDVPWNVRAQRVDQTVDDRRVELTVLIVAMRDEQWGVARQKTEHVSGEHRGISRLEKFRRVLGEK